MFKKILALVCLVGAVASARPFPGEEQVTSTAGSAVGAGLWLETVTFLPNTTPNQARSNLTNLFNHLHPRQHCVTLSSIPDQPGPIWVAVQKAGQTRPTVYPAQAGDGTFWSDAFKVLGGGDRWAMRGAYLGKVERRNFPSEYLEVWTFSDGRRSPDEQIYATATLARVAHWGQPVRAVVVHLLKDRQQHLASASLSPTGRLNDDLLAPPDTGLWKLAKAEPKPW
jgi:hypothetical protein